MKREVLPQGKLTANTINYVPVNVCWGFDVRQFWSCMAMAIAIAVLPFTLGLFFLFTEFQSSIFSRVYSYLKIEHK